VRAALRLAVVKKPRSGTSIETLRPVKLFLRRRFEASRVTGRPVFLFSIFSVFVFHAKVLSFLFAEGVTLFFSLDLSGL
jgi:hypothetical protein